MIIDTVKLAGLDAYFQKPGSPGDINLAAQVRSRTRPPAKGTQLDVSGIDLLIESSGDLRDLFSPAIDTSTSPATIAPLLSISVMKEVFPALFAEPYRHRVHTIAGFDDFKRGVLDNGKVMDVDGVPTIVSVGTDLCKWTSALYPMPEGIDFGSAAWDLAAARSTPRDYFRYSLKLHVFDASQTLIRTVDLTSTATGAAASFDPTRARKTDRFDVKGAHFYQVEFSANVKKDAALYEKHTTMVGQSVGTPLLRAVNLLEPIVSSYDIHSLNELLGLSSDYHLFEIAGQALQKMIVRLDLSATLVHSDNQRIANNDANDLASLYEFVEIAVRTSKFSKVEARLVAERLARPKPR